VGQNVGQGKKSCPKASNTVGQERDVCPTFEMYRNGTAGQDNDIYDMEIESVIHELNSKKISLMDFPAATRHRAFLIEKELTEAQNRNDRIKFLSLIKEWRNCFN